MQREGTACLPIVLVNGEELGHGAYPRREELARAAGLVAERLADQAADPPVG